MNNWITRIIKAGQNLKTKIKKTMATKAEQMASPYMSCHGSPVLKKNIYDNDFVCPECNFHHKMEPRDYYERIFFGKNNYTKINHGIPYEDVLGWEDTKKYTDRLKQAKKLSGLECGILSVEGKIKNIEVVMSCQSWSFIAGSISMPESESVLAAVQRAIEKKVPYIFIAKSSGMRMMTNNLSLIQMSRMTMAINELKRNNLPFISIITNPTTGGTSASIVPIADIIVSEKNAVYGFAGKKIVQNSSSEPLPEDFQSSEWAQKNGQIDKIVDRKELKDTIYNLLSILLKRDSNLNSLKNDDVSEINIKIEKAS